MDVSQKITVATADSANALNEIVAAATVARDRFTTLKEFTARIQNVAVEDISTVKITSQNSALYAAFREDFHRAEMLGEEAIKNGLATAEEVRLAIYEDATFSLLDR